MKSIDYPGGVRREVDYDARGPVSEIRIKPPAGTPLIERWTYTYTDVLNVATMTDGASRQTAYQYDALDRLTQADHPTMPPPLDSLPDAENFTYDGVGDRTMTGYAHDANHRMRASPGHTYDYDDDGNLVVRDPNTPGQVNYTWDRVDRLSAYSSASAAATYDYDPFGRRVRRTSSGLSTWSLWSNDRLATEYGNSGQRTMRYAFDGRWTPDEIGLGTSLSSESRLFPMSDRLDAPRLLVGALGSVHWRATYASFGAAFVDLDPDGDLVPTTYSVRLPGQTEEPSGSLYYNRARYMDPANGRYLSSDPLIRFASDGKYPYAADNPTNLVDPLGLTWGSNIHFLFDWLLGLGSSTRTYSEEDVELSEMRDSPGAAALRAEFARRGCQTFKGFGYDSGRAWWETLADPETRDWSSTAAQVGGFAGASATNNEDGTVTYSIPNVAGAHSFFYHAVPDRSSVTGPMSNVYQDFNWKETIGQCGCPGEH